MSEYAFTSQWVFDAPIGAVWKAIEDADNWPKWWKGVVNSVEVRPGDEKGIGSIRRTTWKSALPYKIEFDSEVVNVERPTLLEVRAFGELEGKGVWTLFVGSDNKTHVRYDWSVKTTKRWMNLLSPLLKPAFRWNHDKIMGWGENGLRALLEARPK